MAKKHIELNFRFVVPAARLLKIAGRLVTSNDQDERDVAKALLDTTKITLATQSELLAKAKTEENLNLAPYFDHWIGDALEAADRLKQSTNVETRELAKCLIEQTQAITTSKEMFLIEAKKALP